MGTISCNGNQSSNPTGIKKHNYSFPPPIDANMKRIGFTASEEKSLENVDDGRTTTDSSIYYKLTYEPSAQVR